MARNVQVDVSRQGGGGKRLVLVVVVIALAGGGYYAWRQYEKTGEIPGMDAEESAEFAERAKEFKEKGSEKFGEILTDSRELLGKRKADLEKWFKERDIKLPTRKELAATADKYLKSDDESKAEPEARSEDVPAAEAVASRSEAERPRRADDEEDSSSPPADEGPADLRTDRRVDAFDVDPRILGRREFRRGFERWKAAPPASPGEQTALKAAREHFTAARDHFQEAAKTFRDDPKLEEYITDCNRFIYDCMKRTVLDMD
jgi:hypothetical protein